ncbi:family 43 glycosylhydrolase [Streptomyces sp. NPDC059629]|uniref:family 43 glycosylhydrolase n=1 Tax=Streptomyces sp. NPDC059629 TaxID=3346889 RepID=UPI0036D06B93
MAVERDSPVIRTRPWLVLVAALLAVLASFATTQPATAAVGRPFANPVKAQKGADPWLLRHPAHLCTGERRRRPHGPVHLQEPADRLQPHPGGWLIDPSVLEYGGKLYLVGSGFVGGGAQSPVIAPMNNPYTVSGSAFTVISQPTPGRETSGAAVDEGPEPLYRDGRTFPAFSASYCQTADCKLGLLELTGTDPLDPASWTKLDRLPRQQLVERRPRPCTRW